MLYPIVFVSIFRCTQFFNQFPYPFRSSALHNPKAFATSSNFCNYLLAPQWHLRSPEQQLPGSASLPSGPMQVCVMAHQKRPSPERGTVGSGSDHIYWLFQCNAEQSPARSLLKRSGTLLMLRLPHAHCAQPQHAQERLPRPVWPALPLRGQDGFFVCCGPGSLPWTQQLLPPHRQ